MTTVLTFLILIAPFAVAAGLGWVAHHTGIFRFGFAQSRIAAPMAGVFSADPADDRDSYRIEHDVDAIRTRFEQQPSWPASGVLGERR